MNVRRVSALPYVIFLSIAALGLPSVIDIMAHGHANISGSQVVPWGLWVAGYLFFIGLSVGAFVVATLTHVFGLERFRALTRLALITSLATLVVGLLLIAADLGRPAQAINIFLYPHFESVMTWVVWLYSAFGVILLAQIWNVMRPDWGRSRHRLVQWLALPTFQRTDQAERNARLSRTLGTAGLVVAVALEGAVGGLLAVIGTREFWHSGLLPISFIVSALISGGAFVLLLALIICRRSQTLQDSLLALGKLVGCLLAIELLVMAAEFFVVLKGGIPAQVGVAQIILGGPYSWVFWILQLGAGTLLPLALIFLSARPSIRGVATAALLILVGTFAFRLNVVIPQLTEPSTVTYLGTRPFVHVYTPSVVEWNFLLFGVGTGGVILLFLARLLAVHRAETTDEHFALDSYTEWEERRHVEHGTAVQHHPLGEPVRHHARLGHRPVVEGRRGDRVHRARASGSAAGVRGHRPT